MTMVRPVVTLMLLACISEGLEAQRDLPVQRFVAEARAGTQRYQRQEAAIADGYKRVGVEFPAMGEHWVSLERVMEDTLLPARPAVLIYTTVRGQPRLAGVGYTALLDPGEEPPAYAPATGHWHEHNGSVAEESLPALHGESHGATHGGSHGATHGGSQGPSRGAGGNSRDGVPPIRLAILHAWVWTENPAGVFVTDNWALPPLRAGARAEGRYPRAVVRGMALAADDEGYYVQILTTRLALTAAEQAAAKRVVDAHRTRAAAVAARDPQAAALGQIWSAMWAELARVLPKRAAGLRGLEREL